MLQPTGAAPTAFQGSRLSKRPRLLSVIVERAIARRQCLACSSKRNDPHKHPIGAGESEPVPKYGELIDVARYHRGAVNKFSWHPSLASVQRVAEVTASIPAQMTIDTTLRNWSEAELWKAKKGKVVEAPE